MAVNAKGERNGLSDWQGGGIRDMNLLSAGNQVRVPAGDLTAESAENAENGDGRGDMTCRV